MKRLLSYLLAFCLLFSASAVSESVGGPIIEPEPEITIDRVYKTLNMNGEESLTHGWIVVDVTITNYSLHTISAKDDIAAYMLYDGMYEFSAEPVFAISEFEPLMRLSGSMVFKVPKLVLEAESYKTVAALKIDGKIIPINLDFGEKTSGISVESSFDTPEELLVTFIDCLKNADFENLLDLFAYKEKSQYLDFKMYLPVMKVIQHGSSTVFPAYKAYDALNEFCFIQAYQINTMLLSLFSERAGARGMVIQYRNGAVTGQDYFSGEEMTLDEYADRLNPERLNDLSLESIGRMPIDPESRQRENNIRDGLIYGYSDSREYVLRVSFEGETYYLGAALCRFPEGWKIDRLTCQEFSQKIGMYAGEFVKEERTGDFDFDQLIYTWENGEIISKNLLPEPEIASEDLIGTWTCDEGTLVFDGKYLKSIAHADGYEGILLYCISENYLYTFTEDGRNEGEVKFALNGDLLTLLGNEDQKLTLQREK